MEREQLIDIVRRLQTAEGTEEELDRLEEVFLPNVPHPEASDLICYRDGDGLTTEEIVDEALAYKAIPLGPAR